VMMQMSAIRDGTAASSTQRLCPFCARFISLQLTLGYICGCTWPLAPSFTDDAIHLMSRSRACLLHYCSAALAEIRRFTLQSNQVSAHVQSAPRCVQPIETQQ
jgi:hypothetical protein